jgi:DNA-binding NarL/FixJ family response regulator
MRPLAIAPFTRLNANPRPPVVPVLPSLTWFASVASARWDPASYGKRGGVVERDRLGQPGRIRVLIVDDYDLFRTGLVSLLSDQTGIEVVGQASGGRAGVRLAGELKPDVVLMDLRLQDIHGSEATRMIVDQRPSTRVIALTVLSADRDVVGAVNAGACGFLAKDAPIEDVATAVRAAADGSAWLSPRAAEVVLGRMREASERDKEALPTAKLTPRERDVLRLIARGMENAEIANALNISPRTAKNHVSSILGKLGFPSRIQAAVFAVRQGWD